MRRRAVIHSPRDLSPRSTGQEAAGGRRRSPAGMGAQGRRVGRAATVGIALGAIAVGAALLSPLLAYPFGRDQGVFATAADVLSRGGVPYRDVWDVKPPGGFYLYWASFALFGRSELAPRALDLVWTLATAAAVFALGKRLLSAWAGAAAALFLIVRYVAGNTYWNTTQPDGFAALPLCLAVVAMKRTDSARHPRWAGAITPAILSGALIGMAMLLKLTVAAFLIVPIAAALFDRRAPIRSRLWTAGAYVAGCAMVLGVVAALMWRAGALQDMIQVLVTWNAAYSRLRPPVPMSSDPLYQTERFLLGLPYQYLFPIGLLAVVGTADLALRRDSARLRWLPPCWALALMASVWAQGKFYTYHWLPLLPPLALLAAQGMRAISHLLRKSLAPVEARVISVAGVGLVLAILGLAYWRACALPVSTLTGRIPRSVLLARYNNYGDFSLLADREVASFITNNTATNDTIFIWGFEPLIYFLADRRPASRFIYTVPLVTDWSPSEWRAELIGDLDHRRPRYVLVVHNDALPWMTGRLDDSFAQLGAFPELQQLIQSRYASTGGIEDFDVWRRR